MTLGDINKKTGYSVTEGKKKALFYFVPSRLSQSSLLQAVLPGQELGRKPPVRNSISAHCRFAQTGYCHAGWHSVSRPAGVHMPLTPEKRGQQILFILIPLIADVWITNH